MTHADRQRIYRVAIWLTKVMPVAISLVYVANTVCAFMGHDVPLFSWVAAMSLLPLILFYVLSYALNMCSWHRALLHYIAVTEAVGFTYTDFTRKRSVVGISGTTTQAQLLNTIVHEAKHVQSHICRYYHVEEDSEQAAYLIGYIVQKMHDFFRYKISTGRE